MFLITSSNAKLSIFEINKSTVKEIGNIQALQYKN